MTDLATRPKLTAAEITTSTLLAALSAGDFKGMEVGALEERLGISSAEAVALIEAAQAAAEQAIDDERVTALSAFDNLVSPLDFTDIQPTLDLIFDDVAGFPGDPDRSSVAGYFDANGVWQEAAADALRIDHDPVTGVNLGALIEGARTNYATYSEALSNWSATTNVTVTDNAITVKGIPFSKVEATTDGPTNVNNYLGGVGATEMVCSLKAKKGSGATDANRVGIYNGTTPGTAYAASINWDTGAVTEISGAANGETIVKDIGDGVWDIEIRITGGINVGDALYVYGGFTGTSETAGEYAYFSHVQLEAGKFATSYIKTEASTVTRAADLPTLPTDGWYNPAGGTFYVEASTLVPTGGDGVGGVVLSVGGSSYNDTLYISHPNGSGNVALTVRSGGSTEAVISAGAAAEMAVHRIAAAFREDDFAISMNGAASAVDFDGAMPTEYDMCWIGNANWSTAAAFNGHIKRLIYWPSRLPNATLEAMTA